MEIIVANDTVQNFLFHNLKGEKFEEVAQKSGVAYGPDGQARGAMGCDVAAFRHNGTYGILIGNFAKPSVHIRVLLWEPERTAPYADRDA